MTKRFTTAYKRKTKRSAKLFLQSKKLHVNGVSHNIRYFEPYPFVVKKASGKSLIDVDDNKYTDYWMGHWSLILGHKPAAVRRSLKEQIERDWMYGTVNEQTILLSETISKSIPLAEKIRYVTSGTEATMYAVRLARSTTGKKIITKIDGGWHGYTSDLLKTVNWPFDISESKGLINEEKIISIPYNNIDESLAILQKHSKDLAGVIIEPLLGGGGCIPASSEYMKALNEFVHKNGSLLIIDEIVTGYRFKFGCLYDSLGAEPDIITLGKIAGGGMPIGIICGKEEVMRIADTTTKKKNERAYIGGGTFSANPMSMTAGYHTLSELKSNTQIYSKINSLGKKIRERLAAILSNDAVVTGIGSLFMTHFTDKLTQITNASEAAKCDTGTLYQYHLKMMAEDGIFFLPGKLGAISNSHSHIDVKEMTAATEDFVSFLHR